MVDFTRRQNGARYTGYVKVRGKMWQTSLYSEMNHMIHTQHRREANEYMEAPYTMSHDTNQL